ncbi:hypothetical protein HPE56_18815 [Maribacter sp. ANRC-HE7]|uniref:Peptidase E n=1 Tax=Maribacter aquimaris TaxID=2737171 RepID=A0ABR7V7F3_9FLAO|nr:DUF6702 family protein [Maribacter aquimaris]MBD0779855.1 hypothetical protein [Maribacter aquimaris]
MKFLKKSLVVLLLPLLAFTVAHKFYLSVTNVTYSEKDQAIQITSRIFIDDFDDVLQERYGIESQLATPWESELADAYIEKYLRSKFLVYLNGEQQEYDYLGKEYDNDIMICYIEIPKVAADSMESITIQSELLTDLFEEQQNVVHLKILNQKKSFVLIRENNKGMLKM